MSNPEKVLGFLDVFGQWDASLAFVMGGAVVVTTLGYRWIGRAGKPWFNLNYAFPTLKHIDKPLVTGALIFGVGWGLVGLCPGPALTAFVVEPWAILVFVASMLIGMTLARRFSKQFFGTAQSA